MNWLEQIANKELKSWNIKHWFIRYELRNKKLKV